MARKQDPKILVSREKVKGIGFKQANQRLRDIGMLVKDADEALAKDCYIYLGSLAVHYYSSEVLHHACFGVQIETLAGVHKPLVNQGLKEAKKQAQVFFGDAEWRDKGWV